MTWEYTGSYGRRARVTRAVRVLLLVNIAVFFLQALLDRWTGDLFTWIFGLRGPGLARGWIWQLVTYMFLHGSAWHLFVNMLVLFFMGPETELALGLRRFLVLYFMSGVLGGVGWVLISPSGVPCVGASGAIFGILGAFAALFPEQPITLLLFFVLPITMKAWVLVTALTLLELASLVSGHGGHIAYAAHVSGAIAGYIYAAVGVRGIPLRWRWPGRPRLRIVRNAEGPSAAAAEVDRILDKIAAEGMGSLTPRERDVLERASRARGSRS